MTAQWFFQRGVEERRRALVAQELDREVASYVSRDTAMQQRATVLIGAASITGALQVTAMPDWVSITSLFLSFLAAVAGVVVVFPRTGDALDVRAMRAGMEDKPFSFGHRKLIDVKLEILEADERWLTIRGWFARGGLIALSASIAIATGAALASPDPVRPAPSPTSNAQPSR